MGALESALESLARIADALEAIAAMMQVHSSRETTRECGRDSRPEQVRPEEERPEESDPSPNPEEPSDRGDEDHASEPLPTDPGRSAQAQNSETVRGAAYGVSNFRFYSLAPRVVRRLLRDDRSIQTGVLTSTLDHELSISHNMRTLVLARLRAECGFLAIAEAPRGVAPYVRITDVDGARRWLTKQEKDVSS